MVLLEKAFATDDYSKEDLICKLGETGTKINSYEIID